MQELTNAQFLRLLGDRKIDVSSREGRLQISAPAGALNATLRAELTRRKAELLSALENTCAAALPSPLVRAERTTKIPQTDAQQGLWVIDQLDPGCVAYNIPEAFLVEAPVDLATLQTAVDRLLARHETLRTYFYEEDDELFQAVAPAVHARVEFTDLSGLIHDTKDPQLVQLIREQGRRPFALDQAPLVRFHLFRLTEQRHVMFFNIHHIISDRRSLTILRQELTLLYLAAEKNESASLPDLPVQYADYAIWAASNANHPRMAQQMLYWKTKLADLPPYLDLPGSRPYPEERTPWGATTSVAIDATLRNELGKICHQESATLFMALLTTFAVLLFVESGKDDFCIGSPSTFRKQVETEPLIGYFVNMLVFRCQFAGAVSFRDALRRVRATALEAYENSDVSFQAIVRALKPDPRSRRAPFFQVMFGLEAVVEKEVIGSIQLDPNPGTARFDLTLQLSDNIDGVSGYFEYCTDLFAESSVVKLSRQWESLVKQVCVDPDRPLCELQLPQDPEESKRASDVPSTSSNLKSEKPGIGQRVRELFFGSVGRK